MIDPATGLPELPEGQWWELHLEHVDDTGYLYELRVMSGVPYDYTIVMSARFRPRHPLTPARVRYEAEWLLERTAARDVAQSLLGSYPPKRLVV
jgi:hypothetical protein